MKPWLILLALISSSSIASAQYVFGGCPEPKLAELTEATSKQAPCTAELSDADKLKGCGATLGDDKHALTPDPALTARLVKRDGIEVRGPTGDKIASWPSYTKLDCASRVFVSTDRKTLAVEVMLDEMTLDARSDRHVLVVFHLKKPAPTRPAPSSRKKT